MRISVRALLLVSIFLVSTGCKRKTSGDYLEERWDDSQLGQQARLQFVWIPRGEKAESIFTLGTDGGHIRRVVRPEVLFSGEAKSIEQYPVRSPNRRYLACAGEDAQSDELRFLVDLETRTVRTMLKATNPTDFTWTPDSRRVLFWGDNKLWEYDVETGALTQLPPMGPLGLRLVDGGRHFVALRDHAVELRDPSGKVLKRVPVNYRLDVRHAISDDGRFVALSDVRFTVVDLEKPDTPLFTTADAISSVAFDPAGGRLYYFTDGLNALDLATGAVTNLGMLPKAETVGGLTALAPVVSR